MSDVLGVDIDGGRRIEEILEDPFARKHLTYDGGISRTS